MSNYRDNEFYIPTQNIERIDWLYRTMREMMAVSVEWPRHVDHGTNCVACLDLYMIMAFITYIRSRHADRGHLAFDPSARTRR